MSTLKNFQAFTIRATGTTDCIVSDISVVAAYDLANPPDPLPTALSTKALWDTGASKSVLSVDFVKALGLTPVGTREVHHGDGKSVRNTYLVNFGLPNGVQVTGVLATEFPASHNHFSVLVGMDVIKLGDFAITHVGGKTCASFRTPSCETIDYVVEANKLKYAGSERNAPCRCGSGKKYKRCHGA